ncbi:hypothetical protein SDRG_08870 [Saprolegnia diclina VS20]|uniref:Peptidase C1A papain C-terminal domain-containing protein n=1 Tax=Saprolegnia diclina (strain VS20) TaxID=1156394 RepID=T0RN39_SAPDV|nr:hypothetical protein SDRG_08870 [Saprolegnia diclina VS20]EQC33768.1 hypothetical protein SDRG_08870 [Saprolegnia diclina VS20]|eukprot:XP_008612991.1 hypothetical protein SDRG_08870 [Saprolegnia diclina VS20]
MTTPTAHGSLVACNDDGDGCRWMGRDGASIGLHQLIDELLEADPPRDVAATRASLVAHAKHLQAKYARAIARHENPEPIALQLPIPDLTSISTTSRSLSNTTSSSSNATELHLPVSLNWCSTNNPLQRRICGPMRAQGACNGCWAFATVEIVQAAVSAATGAAPVPLSPQQLLDCSRGNNTYPTSYCMAGMGSLPSWLPHSIEWSSANGGCNGGSTYGALLDLAWTNTALALDTDWPFVDASKNATDLEAALPPRCKPAAELINGFVVERPKANGTTVVSWRSALPGSACAENVTDPVRLLKTALLDGPISVPIYASEAFKNYNGGVHVCTTNITTSSINHVLVLTGYGVTDNGTEHWILKNSYGNNWGLRGFMHLAMDDVLNCGMLLLPIQVDKVIAGASSTDVSYKDEGTGSGGTTTPLRKTNHNAPYWILAVVAVLVVAAVAAVVVLRRRHQRRKSMTSALLAADGVLTVHHRASNVVVT